MGGMVPRRQGKEPWKVIGFEISRVSADDPERDGSSRDPAEETRPGSGGPGATTSPSPGTGYEEGASQTGIPGEEFLLPLSLSSSRPTTLPSASRITGPDHPRRALG